MKINNLSRRNFLNLVGVAGGSTAIYQTSLAMGVMSETSKPAKLLSPSFPKDALPKNNNPL